MIDLRLLAKLGFTILVWVSVSTFSIAQDNDIIQHAMKDELDRSMKELVLEGHEKPFFINYTMLDQTSLQVTASLGAIIRSSESPSRIKTSVRILVGGFDFNDESLDNNSYSASRASDLALPIDDDYDGIRRSFWSTTDYVYRNAAAKFKKNQEDVKDASKSLAEIPHRRFAKVPPSSINRQGSKIQTDREKLEDYVRVVSAVFKNYSLVKNSGVNFHFTQGHSYLINSEGSTNKTPFSLATLQIGWQIKTAEDVVLFDEITEIASDPSQLPPAETMRKKIEEAISLMIDISAAPAFDEEYTGPVLYSGNAVADLIRGKIISSQDGLMAQNNVPPLKGYQIEANKAMESKIGKPLFAEGMTIKAMPKLKNYKGVNLLGSFEVDNEGVVPSDEITLVENGILKDLMNDRTVINENQSVNGLGAGPGVLAVSFKQGYSLIELKAKLIAQAKKQGLEYALLIKGTNSNRSGINHIYKVFVSNGKEVLYRSPSVKSLSQKDLKKIIGVSNENEVYQSRSNNYGSGSVISMILPNALILEEVEVSEARRSILKEEEYVSSPLKK